MASCFDWEAIAHGFRDEFSGRDTPSAHPLKALLGTLLGPSPTASSDGSSSTLRTKTPAQGPRTWSKRSPDRQVVVLERDQTCGSRVSEIQRPLLRQRQLRWPKQDPKQQVSPTRRLPRTPALCHRCPRNSPGHRGIVPGRRLYLWHPQSHSDLPGRLLPGPGRRRPQLVPYEVHPSQATFFQHPLHSTFTMIDTSSYSEPLSPELVPTQAAEAGPRPTSDVPSLVSPSVLARVVPADLPCSHDPSGAGTQETKNQWESHMEVGSSVAQATHCTSSFKSDSQRNGPSANRGSRTSDFHSSCDRDKWVHRKMRRHAPIQQPLSPHSAPAGAAWLSWQCFCRQCLFVRHLVAVPCEALRSESGSSINSTSLLLRSGQEDAQQIDRAQRRRARLQHKAARHADRGSRRSLEQGGVCVA